MDKKIETLDEYIDILKSKIAKDEEELTQLTESIKAKSNIQAQMDKEIRAERAMAERIYSVFMARKNDLASLIGPEEDNHEPKNDQ